MAYFVQILLLLKHFLYKDVMLVGTYHIVFLSVHVYSCMNTPILKNMLEKTVHALKLLYAPDRNGNISFFHLKMD